LARSGLINQAFSKAKHFKDKYFQSGYSGMRREYCKRGDAAAGQSAD
jgi:hypothetical protein